MSAKIIQVMPYDPRWPQIFEAEAAKIQSALGDRLLAIHHIGSTAVPGLAAKPIIDIIAVVKDLSPAISPLQSLGYRYKGEFNIPMRYYFDKKQENEVHLHLMEEGHAEIALNLTFRDYLRTHPEARDAYAHLKEELLQKKSSYERVKSSFSGYALGKDSFIKDCLNKANFDCIRLLKCAHYVEWDAAKAYRQKRFSPAEDPSFEDPNHAHLILYKGTKIIGYAHIEFTPEDPLLHMLVVEEEPFEKEFSLLIQKWLSKKT